MRAGSLLIVGVLFPAILAAQALPPGYVDPAPLLAAASKEIGEANLKCITISGTAYAGAVGQAFESAVNVDWPVVPLMNYTRTIDFEKRTLREEFDRAPGRNPASWKYGVGWQDGTPTQKNSRQTFIISGDYGWHMDGADAPPVPMSAEDVARGRLEIWMNPHGFLKAARLPGANPKAVWRWEHARSASSCTHTGHDHALSPDPHARSGRGDDCTRARPAGADERVPRGDGTRRQRVPDPW